ncbi:MAG: hypothetical protein GF330_06480, partial [Candidatus Eisenbacteria bacterium]|nr:hypothetical protein [Candidatus Eisenbacteria bacterium]
MQARLPVPLSTGNQEDVMHLPHSLVARALALFVALVGAPLTAGADTLLVTSLASSGSGTLHAAIDDANTYAGPDTIVFTGLSGTITLTDPLPALTDDGTLIMGETADDAIPALPDITLQCDYVSLEPGLYFQQASDCGARGLNFLGFIHAVKMEGPCSGNSLGASLSIRTANVIANSTDTAVYLVGPDCDGNTIVNNNVGSNAYWGIGLVDGCSSNVIGGNGANEMNVISGNDGFGLFLSGDTAPTQDNRIIGNHIGVDFYGTAPSPNASGGLHLSGPLCRGNVIHDNIISGNDQDGVGIENGAHHNTLSSNHIGMDINGSLAIPNGGHGVDVNEAAHDNTIGPGNLISANLGCGVHVRQLGSDGNEIVGSLVGLDGTGTTAFGNGEDGIQFSDGAQSCVVQGCTVAGNGLSGIHVTGAGTDLHRIRGCRIGTDVSGMVAIANGST